MYDEIVCGYFANMDKKVESEMKSHLFVLEYPVSIIGFLTTLEPWSDLNLIHERAAMRVIPRYVTITLANALNSRMVATDKSSVIAAAVCDVEYGFRKLSRSYQKVVIYFLKKFATNETTAYFDVAILQYIQSPNMTTWQYADDQFANLLKVSDVHGEITLIDLFIERVHSPFWHSFKHNWAPNPQ